MGTNYGGGSMTAGAKPGTWRLRVFLGNDPVTGKPRQKQVTFYGSETAARKSLRQMVTEVCGANTGTTVGGLLDRWLEHIEPERSPKTILEYRSKIERRIRPMLGDVPLDKLTAAMLDSAYAKWRTELSGNTVHHCHAIISAACRQAVKWGWLVSAPTEKADPPKLVLSNPNVPEADQVSGLYGAALARTDSMLATGIALAAMTGARRGELAALRWSDIDLTPNGGRIHIRGSLAVIGAYLVEKDTKSHAERTVAIDADAAQVLSNRWQHQQEAAAARGMSLVSDPYVLANDEVHDGSQPANPDIISHRFRRLARSLDVKCRFHDLRHFSVTTLIAAGMDVKTVADRHGHKHATMTLNRYAHALPEKDRESAGILSRALQLGACSEESKVVSNEETRARTARVS